VESQHSLKLAKELKNQQVVNFQ